jgi:four helix bundle protein
LNEKNLVGHFNVKLKYRMMSEKEDFINEMKLRTKKLAVDIIKLCNDLKKGKASDVITYQLIKSATSTGANYRASCRARSKQEFFSKICIVVEEADESEYWLEIIDEANLYANKDELDRVSLEASEITKIMSKAKASSYKQRGQ